MNCGLNVVVPTSAIDLSVKPASSVSALRLLVLPWSADIPGGGVPLQMLDGNKVFTDRQFDVRHGDVMHEINPLAGRVSCRCNPAGLQMVAADLFSRHSGRRTGENRLCSLLQNPARAPSANASANENLPCAAPATVTRCRHSSGTKQARSIVVLAACPPAWE